MISTMPTNLKGGKKGGDVGIARTRVGEDPLSFGPAKTPSNRGERAIRRNTPAAPAPTATASTNNAELPSSSPPSPPSRRGKELRKMNKSPVKKKASVKKAKAHKAGGKGRKTAYKKTNAAKANAKVAMEKKKAKPNGKKAVVSDAVNDNLVPSFSDDSGDLKSPMNSPFLCGFLFCEF